MRVRWHPTMETSEEHGALVVMVTMRIEGMELVVIVRIKSVLM